MSFKPQLRQLISRCFNEGELRTLCFDLEIDYANLAGETKLERVRELISYCERQGLLEVLIDACGIARPHIAWPLKTVVFDDQKPEPANEKQQLEQAIAALEAQRPILGNAVVDAGLAPIREQLAALDHDNPALKRQRKHVTVLVARRSGFTVRLRQDELERVSGLMQMAWELVNTAMLSYGGWLDGHQGETIRILFGFPQSKENDPERAVRAALEAQKALTRFEEEHAFPINLTVGIHTGLVLLDRVGHTEKFTAVGETVRVAERLHETAAANTVSITEMTYRHIRGVFDVELGLNLSSPNDDRPLATYIVTAAKTRPFYQERYAVAGREIPLIGRQIELQQLQDAWHDVQEEKECQMITIIGDPGIGKSRLLHEFDSWIELQPEEVVYYTGRASQDMQTAPYGLLRDIIARRAQIRENDPLLVVQEKMEQEIVNRLSWQTLHKQMRAHFIGHLLGYDFSESPFIQAVDGDAEQLKNRGLLYLTEYFQALEFGIILLEDLHWADESSLDGLVRLMNTLATHSILIVATARHSLVERRPNWGDGYDWHQRLSLRPLSRSASRRFVQELLNELPKVPVALQNLLLGKGSGTPLYLEEFVKELFEVGIVWQKNGTWHVDEKQLEAISIPPTVVGIFQARFDRLSEVERADLQRAAVVGSVFWDSAIRHLRQNETLNQSVENSLASLHGREIIFRREQSAFINSQEYRFKHDILREVVYESALREDRAKYHALVADWFQSDKRKENFETTAHHLEMAGKIKQAIVLLQKASMEAEERFAHAEALNITERLLKYLSDPVAIAEARVTQSRLLSFFGRHLEAHRYLQETESLVKHLPNKHALMIVKIALGEMNKHFGNSDQALEALTAAETLATQSQDQVKLAYIYSELSAIYSAF